MKILKYYGSFTINGRTILIFDCSYYLFVLTYFRTESNVRKTFSTLNYTFEIVLYKWEFLNIACRTDFELNLTISVSNGGV